MFDAEYDKQAALDARGRSKTVRSILKHARVPNMAAWAIIQALETLKCLRPPCPHCKRR